MISGIASVRDFELYYFLNVFCVKKHIYMQMSKAGACVGVLVHWGYIF